MRGTWLVIVEGLGDGTPMPPFEVEVREAVTGWVASAGGEFVHAKSARVAVGKIGAHWYLPVLEILAPDEMSREEEIAATCATVLDQTVDHALAVLKAGHESSVTAYDLQVEALGSVRLRDPS